MSGPFGSSQWMYNAGSDYEIDNSLRFNDNDAANLARTPSSTGNQRTWTWSCWVKRGASGAEIRLFGCYQANDSPISLKFDGNDKLSVDNWAGQMAVTVNRFRDFSAWYHIILALDTTQSAAANRAKFYVNGVQQATVAGGAGFPGLNLQAYVNLADQDHRIGTLEPYDGSQYFDGCLAEMHFVDGAALTPSSFGETDDTHGHWKPIDCKDNLTYGTNGFYLDFKSSGVGTASSSTVGADRSGNDNHWTSNALAATDQMIDTPTNNFATWNASSYDGGTAMTEGNLNAYGSGGTSANEGGTATIGVTSGKWYWENRIEAVGNSCAIGIFPSNNNPKSIDDMYQGDPSIYYKNDGNKQVDDSSSSYGNSFTTDDIIGVALNLDDNEIKFYKNNTVQNSGTAIAVTVTSEHYNPVQAGTGNSQVTVNFGQDSSFAGNETAQGNQDGNSIGDFYYAPPSGFLALCTNNLPEPAVTPSENFNPVIYTGDGSAQDITTVGFQPDFTWIKNRSANDSHQLFDAVRGVTNVLSSDSTAAEAANDDTLTHFLSNGFTTGDDVVTNTNAENYVAWNWKANGSGSSNTDGSINTTKTSANVDAGFSISTYTGTNANGATIGHGLSKAPEWIIVKTRSANGEPWRVYHSGIASDAETDYLDLNLIVAAADNANIWNDTAPTSSVFSIGVDGGVNADGTTYVAYCFHSVDGYSKVGSYVGNGNADGPFIYTGFRPAYVLSKRVATEDRWVIKDVARDTFNVMDLLLDTNSDGAEITDSNQYVDFLGNGFKLRSNWAETNTDGDKFIYIAFAETPFKYANGR